MPQEPSLVERFKKIHFEERGGSMAGVRMDAALQQHVETVKQTLRKDRSADVSGVLQDLRSLLLHQPAKNEPGFHTLHSQTMESIAELGARSNRPEIRRTAADTLAEYFAAHGSGMSPALSEELESHLNSLEDPRARLVRAKRKKQALAGKPAGPSFSSEEWMRVRGTLKQHIQRYNPRKPDFWDQLYDFLGERQRWAQYARLITRNLNADEHSVEWHDTHEHAVSVIAAPKHVANIREIFKRAGFDVDSRETRQGAQLTLTPRESLKELLHPREMSKLRKEYGQRPI
ncbi:hypothetical protein KJ765_02900 [Candidatus Micrarchaeota archaeon]|nr:hypothetical protein [Candidatus Micrarchaeota archaeon]